MSKIDNLLNRVVEAKMTKYRRVIFARRHESHLMYLVRLYCYNWKDYFFGAVAGCVIAWFLVYSVDARAADAKLMIDIIECESSGRHNAVGDDGVSYGIAQFRKETFYEFAKQAKFSGLRYRNPIHQLKVMSWAMDNGYGYRWTCYRKLHPVMDSVRLGK